MCLFPGPAVFVETQNQTGGTGNMNQASGPLWGCAMETFPVLFITHIFMKSLKWYIFRNNISSKMSVIVWCVCACVRGISCVSYSKSVNTITAQPLLWRNQTRQIKMENAKINSGQIQNSLNSLHCVTGGGTHCYLMNISLLLNPVDPGGLHTSRIDLWRRICR